MSPPPVSIQTTESSDLHSATDIRLRGHWLVLAKVVWITLILLILVIFVIGIPTSFKIALSLRPETRAGLEQLGLSTNFPAIYTIALDTVFMLGFACVAFLIFWRRSDDWFAISVALMLLLTAMLYTAPAFEANVPMVILALLAALGEIFQVAFVYLFPDGRFVPRWTWVLLPPLLVWRPAIWGLVYLPNYFALKRNGENFYYIPQDSRDIGLMIGLFAIGIIAQVYRYRHHSTPMQRQQTKWLVLGMVVAVSVVGSYLLAINILGTLQQLGSEALLVRLLTRTVRQLALILIPITLTFSILRYRLWDIDIIINRTLVYSILTASVVGIYVLTVVSLGTLFQERGNLIISLFATALIAVLFQPLRNRLQRAVNRLMYGEREDPYRVISRLGKRLEATLAPEAVLTTIVETVAQALKLPYAAITLREGGTFTPAASFGILREGEDLVRLPLVVQQELVGELVLAPRAPGESFTPTDQRLLEDLTHQIGVAVYAVRLTADLKRLTVDLQRSRESLVIAREEERRRLRRDLHDGLGPQLASQTLTLTAVRKLLRDDPDTAEMLLTDATVHAQEAITDIRRLVYALRPPALDDLGLIAALREQIAQYHASGVSFTLETPEHLPTLTAAVEVASYRIIQEALTNVVRHAQARTCTLRLTVGEMLTLEVIDDGIGLSPSHRSGVGLSSMRERAAELGGTCVIEPLSEGGTHICARLPLL